MRWVLAGIAFALAVVMAIGTAALRAENTRRRHEVERQMRATWDRVVEYRRLSVAQLEEASAEHLARRHWQALRANADRVVEQLQ